MLEIIWKEKKEEKEKKRNNLKHTEMFISELSIIVKKEKKENTNV